MTREVPREEWESYLNSVSGEYQGCRVDIRVENNEIGNELLVERRPLIAIEPDWHHDTIIIITADPEVADPAELRHFITQPTAIYSQEDELGGVKTIDFESRDEGKTLLAIGLPVEVG